MSSQTDATKRRRKKCKLATEEIRDSSKVLKTKCRKLSEMIRKSRCVVVFTGAGISTSASIPDYRGPNGIWTLAELGKTVTDVASTSGCDPVAASPTVTHLALRELYRCGFIRHVLSQNCDGLHLRSGLPQQALSEIHGNMYVEVCTNCQPNRQFIRTFDVTERTSFRRHKTLRRCDWCHTQLTDSIVHFGEWGKLLWPLNWKGSVRDGDFFTYGATSILSGDSCDLVLVLGSSLQILKQYDFLWPNKEQAKYRQLAIVNLQKTPKHRTADLVIHGECDVVMRCVMQDLTLNVPTYCRVCDPVLNAKRRNAARAKQLMEVIGECHCSTSGTRRVNNINKTDIDHKMSINSSTSISDDTASTNSSHPEEMPKSNMPGWWTSGFAKKRRQSTSYANNEYFGQHRKRGRGRSSKLQKNVKHASCNSSSANTDHEENWSEEDDLPLSHFRSSSKPNNIESDYTNLSNHDCNLKCEEEQNTIIVLDVLHDLIDRVLLSL